MPAKRKPDSFDFSSDGQVKIVFGGVIRTLRRPTVGELKRFNKTLMNLAAEQRGKTADSLDIDEMVSATLEWWGDVIDTLKDDDDLPAPADVDDYPTWMMNTELMVNLQNHWREVPYPSGGK